MRMEDNKDSMEEVWQKLKEKGVQEETLDVVKRGIEKAALEEVMKEYEIANHWAPEFAGKWTITVL